MEKSRGVPCPGSVYKDILKVLKALEAPLLGHVIKQRDKGDCVSIMSMLGKIRSWVTSSSKGTMVAVSVS